MNLRGVCGRGSMSAPSEARPRVDLDATVERPDLPTVEFVKSICQPSKAELGQHPI